MFASNSLCLSWIFSKILCASFELESNLALNALETTVFSLLKSHPLNISYLHLSWSNFRVIKVVKGEVFEMSGCVRGERWEVSGHYWYCFKWIKSHSSSCYRRLKIKSKRNGSKKKFNTVRVKYLQHIQYIALHLKTPKF